MALVVIFLPGWLLVAGAMPYWDGLLGDPRFARSQELVNGAVVGVLGATWIAPLATEGLRSVADCLVGGLALAVYFCHPRALPLMIVLLVGYGVASAAMARP